MVLCTMVTVTSVGFFKLVLVPCVRDCRNRVGGGEGGGALAPNSGIFYGVHLNAFICNIISVNVLQEH